MTFPAREQFDEQHATALGRLYKYCRSHLTFNVPREIKGFNAARYAKIARENIPRMLDQLVAEGFLLEHPREHPKRPRRFTLEYEIAPSKPAA